MKTLLPLILIVLYSCNSTVTNCALKNQLLLPEQIHWDTLFSNIEHREDIDLLYNNSLKAIYITEDSLYILTSVSELTNDSILLAVENNLLYRQSISAIPSDSLICNERAHIIYNGVRYTNAHRLFEESYIRLNHLIKGTQVSATTPIVLP